MLKLVDYLRLVGESLPELREWPEGLADRRRCRTPILKAGVTNLSSPHFKHGVGIGFEIGNCRQKLAFSRYPQVPVGHAGDDKIRQASKVLSDRSDVFFRGFPVIRVA